MRVIAGRWRGRQLKSPPGQSVRPTTDRVKEALFSILGPGIRDSLFLDLCCGSGGLGVEALSRGAARVILVDQAATSLEVARTNLSLCGADPGCYQLIRRDVLAWLQDWDPPADRWHAVADPPYHSGLSWSIFQFMLGMRDREGFLTAVVEHGSGRDPDWDPEGQLETLESVTERRYGRSTLCVMRPSSPCEKEGP